MLVTLKPLIINFNKKFVYIVYAYYQKLTMVYDVLIVNILNSITSQYKFVILP